MKTNAFLLRTFVLLTMVSVLSCQKEKVPDQPTPPPATDEQHPLGYVGDDNVGKVPSTPNMGYGNGTLPSQVDLSSKFPPIGDQGQYGTCVAWATAYNLKTALNGMDKGYSASQLASPANQASPRDLFTAIPDNQKGSDCNGTNFTFALDVLQNRGVASLQTVPYTSLGSCSQSNVQNTWTNEAKNNKIKYWRKINPTVQDVKKNLANNIPVLLAAKLSDNFMTWNSENVLSSNTTYNTVGQHAYHALVIAGYDDSKGAGGAFKVINSWGKYWGSKGYIWIDYNFLLNEFCTTPDGDKPLFIASNDAGSVNPPDQNPSVSGVDLAPWIFYDQSAYATSGNPLKRQINYNFYNIGSQAASSNTNWSVYYIYFNAYDANDYGVLFYDDFNTSTASNSYYCPNSGNCIFNYGIPAGGSFANTVFGTSDITRNYYMPRISGDYYLVLVTDAEDKFTEEDELNNLFYTSIFPTTFNNGYAQKGAQPASAFDFKNDLNFSMRTLKKNKFNSAVIPEFTNAYTPKEILSFFKKEKRSGALQTKINKLIQETGKDTYSHK